MKALTLFDRRYRERWFLLGCLMLSGSIQLSFMAKSSVWHDEGYSLLLAPQSIGRIIARTARDVHPPFYYLILHFWLKLFGSSEIAARSLSMVSILMAIVVMFGLIKRLFGSGAARSAALLMAMGPFLIRYGQEARMYALLTLLLSLGSYLLVSALDTNNHRRLYLYSLVMALAFYTHYYTIFMIPVHWLYVTLRSRRSQPQLKTLNLKNLHWWGANILIGLLFAPWLPVAYHQFTRVQGGFWIPPVTLTTLPNTLGQFLQFNSVNNWPLAEQLGLVLALLILIGVAIIHNPRQRTALILLSSWLLSAPLIVLVASFISRPIYVDRYFVFVSVAFYSLLATLLFLRPLNRLYQIRGLMIALLLGLSVFGIHNVYQQSNHQMRAVGQYVNAHYQAGDELVAGELYVYLDFSYYNHTVQPLQLYAPGGISGYGETSLLYDQPNLILKNYGQLQPSSGRIWLVAKPGTQDYLMAIPASWHLLDSLQNRTSAVYHYQIVR